MDFKSVLRLVVRPWCGRIFDPRHDVDLSPRRAEDLDFAHRSQHGPRMQQVRMQNDADAHRAETDVVSLTFVAKPASAPETL